MLPEFCKPCGIIREFSSTLELNILLMYWESNMILKRVIPNDFGAPDKNSAETVSKTATEEDEGDAVVLFETSFERDDGDGDEDGDAVRFKLSASVLVLVPDARRFAIVWTETGFTVSFVDTTGVFGMIGVTGAVAGACAGVTGVAGVKIDSGTGVEGVGVFSCFFVLIVTVVDFVCKDWAGVAIFEVDVLAVPFVFCWIDVETVWTDFFICCTDAGASEDFLIFRWFCRDWGVL